MKVVGFLVLFIGLILATVPGAAWAQDTDDVDRRGSIATIGEDVVVEDGEVRQGDVFIIGGNLTVMEGGEVTQDVFVIGDVEIAGRVGGDVFAVGNLTVTETAVVERDVTALGDLTLADEAQVSGVIQNPSGGVGLGEGGADDVEEDLWPRLAARLFSVMISMLLAMLLAALTVAVAPQAVTRVRDAATDRPWATTGVGCLAWILFLPLLVALAATVIGVPIFLAMYLVAVLLGWVAIGDGLGRRLFGAGRRWLTAALGTGLLALIGFLLMLSGNFVLACAMFMIVVVLSSWPVGAVLLTLFGSRPWPYRVGPPPGAPPTGGQVAPPAVPPPAVPGPVPEGQEPPTPEPDRPAPEAAELPRTEPVPPSPESQEPPRPSPDAPEAPVPPATDDSDQDIAAPAAAPEAQIVPDADVEEPGLQRVPGVSPVYAYLLKESGIRNLADLADADPARVAEVASAPGVVPVSRDQAAEWVEAARELLGRNR